MSDEPMAAFAAATPGSAALHARALRSLPHGNTRDPVWREPHPIYLERGEGAFVVDVDGRRYLDWWNNATALVLGHARAEVVAAVGRAAAKGLSFAAPTASEIELAERIVERVPSAERVRFTNSGTEAVMLALHLARAATGRTGVVKFEGAYHGGYDPVAVSVTPDGRAAGGYERPTATLEGTGIARPAAADTHVLPWNDAPALERFLTAHGGSIGAVLVEPIANKQGVLTPEPGYLEAVRALADAHGAVLVFDEVISFRASRGGAQERYGVVPDLTTLGKVIGGGLPVGAVAGRWSVMAHAKRGAPDGVVHMGTFNANPMTMAAGIATLDLLTADAYARLEALGARVRAHLTDAIAAAGVPWQVTGVGSMFKVHLHDRPLRNYRDTLPRPKAAELELVTRLALAGHVLPYNAAGAATLPMSDADADALAEAVHESALAMRRAGRTGAASGPPAGEAPAGGVR